MHEAKSFAQPPAIQSLDAGGHRDLFCSRAQLRSAKTLVQALAGQWASRPAPESLDSKNAFGVC